MLWTRQIHLILLLAVSLTSSCGQENFWRRGDKKKDEAAPLPAGSLFGVWAVRSLRHGRQLHIYEPASETLFVRFGSENAEMVNLSKSFTVCQCVLQDLHIEGRTLTLAEVPGQCEAVVAQVKDHRPSMMSLTDGNIGGQAFDLLILEKVDPQEFKNAQEKL